MEFEKTKTYANLMHALKESRRKAADYLSIAAVAEDEGLDQFKELMQKNSRIDLKQAELLERLLGAGISLTDRLEEALLLEKREANFCFQSALEASEEGFNEIAENWQRMTEILQEKIFMLEKLLRNLKQDEMLKKPLKVRWQCRQCGFIEEDQNAPDICPHCGALPGKFEIVHYPY